MKAMLFVLVAISATMVLGNAYAYAPFDVSGAGITMQSYELDYEVNSIILQIQVSESEGVLELTFGRNFFDSTFLEGDDEFFILVDGDELPYTETLTTSKSRTIEANLAPGAYEVEIFASHLLGKTIEGYKIASQIKESNVQLLNEKELLSKQVSDLSAELVDAKVKSTMLESENKVLGEKIFEPANLISETEMQAKSINSFIVEQMTAITAWFKSFF
jgi:hypothetical protein